MKNLAKTLGLLFGIALIIWAIGFTLPKIKDIYHPTQEIKQDTIFYTDTLYFEKTTTDTLPKYRYETIVKRDTLYKWKAKGDSIEKVPRVIMLKKKLPVKVYPLGVIR